MTITLNQPNLPAIVNRYYADMIQNMTDSNIYDQSQFATGYKNPKMGPVLNSVVPETTGGASLVAGTYFYVVVAVFTTLQDSIASLESSVVISGLKNSAQLLWTVVPGAIGYKIYRSTTSGQYANTLIQEINNGATNTFLDTGYLVGEGTPASFQLQISGQITPAAVYQVDIFLAAQEKPAAPLGTISTDNNGNFTFNFSPQIGTNEIYVTVTGQGRSASIYVNSYNVHLFLEMIAEEMLNNWQSVISRSWIAPQLYPGTDLFGDTTIQSTDVDFQNAWGILTSVVNDPSIANQYRALVQAMVLSYKKATTLQALLDVFDQFQNTPNLNWIVFYDVENTGFRIGKTYLYFSVVRTPPNPSLEFQWTEGMVNINNQKHYVQAGNYTIAGNPLPRAVFVYVDGTLDSNGYLNVFFDLEASIGHNLAPANLPNNVKVLAVILTNGSNDIIDIAGNCALTSVSGPRGVGNGPFLCGPTFISRRARLNGRQYKYSRFLMYMPNLISQAPVVVQSVKNLLSDMKPAKMTILFGTELSPNFISDFSTTNNASPTTMTMDASGNSYICNTANNTVEKYNPDGSFNSVFLTLNAPGDILYYNNLIYISWNLGTLTPTVSAYNLSAVHQFDFTGTPSPSIYGGLAVDSFGKIYAVDYIAGFIDYFNGTTGVYINQFAFPASFGVLFATAKIEVDPASGNLYIIDANHDHLVHVWSPYPGTPTHLFDFGSSTLQEPMGIAIDSTGLVYVSDFGNESVSVFDVAGNFKYSFGSLGSGPGQMQGPIDVFIDTSGNIYVVDQGNLRVDKFAYSQVFQEI